MTEGPDSEKVYGEAWAAEYDSIHDEVDRHMLAVLAELAGLGSTPPRALELAVGTGRVAIPLAERGVAVTGVDVSESMLERLAAKEHDRVETVLGDMVEVPVDEDFPLVYLVANSLFVISTQERQVECFRNVARVLEPGGRFLIECFVPDPGRFDAQNTRMSVTELGDGLEHAYEMAIHDPVAQTVTSRHVRSDGKGATTVFPVDIRYAWPSELDLMATIAGLVRESRWTWYDRSAFSESSRTHVSVYLKR